MPLPQNTVPTYELTVPTSKQKIKYRPFLVGEQKIALMAAEVGVSGIISAMRQIVDNCTFNKLDVDNMPDFEIEWLFLNIRIRSIGESIEMVVTCQHCGGKHDYMLNLTGVELVVDPSHTSKIMISDSMGIEMTYPTAQQLDALQKNYTTEAFYSTIMSCMKTVFTLDEVFPCKDESTEELQRWMETLTDEQFSKIEHFFASMPVVKHQFVETCPTCEKQTKYTLEGVESFFA